jgi:hypothetical protein
MSNAGAVNVPRRGVVVYSTGVNEYFWPAIVA